MDRLLCFSSNILSTPTSGSLPLFPLKIFPERHTTYSFTSSSINFFCSNVTISATPGLKSLLKLQPYSIPILLPLLYFSTALTTYDTLYNLLLKLYISLHLQPRMKALWMCIYIFVFFIFTSLFQCLMWNKLFAGWMNENYGSFYLWKSESNKETSWRTSSLWVFGNWF